MTQKVAVCDGVKKMHKFWADERKRTGAQTRHIKGNYFVNFKLMDRNYKCGALSVPWREGQRGRPRWSADGCALLDRAEEIGKLDQRAAPALRFDRGHRKLLQPRIEATRS